LSKPHRRDLPSSKILTKGWGGGVGGCCSVLVVLSFAVAPPGPPQLFTLFQSVFIDQCHPILLWLYDTFNDDVCLRSPNPLIILTRLSTRQQHVIFYVRKQISFPFLKIDERVCSLEIQKAMQPRAVLIRDGTKGAIFTCCV
jgi:hypothetical protein